MSGEGMVGLDESRIAVVIEDEADIRALLADVLQSAGFTVHAAAAGVEGVELVRTHQPVVTTLDVNMPGIDGFETARRIRAVSPTYIVMLTARTEEIDALMGLDAGADDYIAKPFRPRELRARIDAMMRRPRSLGPSAGGQTPPVAAPAPASADIAASPESSALAYADAPGWWEHRGLRLHTGMRIATVDGVELDLTRSEFEILAEVLASGRLVVSKHELVRALRDDRYSGSEFVTDADTRAIEVHIANLRRKLGDSPSQPRWIETVRGAGYRLTAE